MNKLIAGILGGMAGAIIGGSLGLRVIISMVKPIDKVEPTSPFPSTLKVEQLPFKGVEAQPTVNPQVGGLNK